jgi:hypothetical protein
MTNRSTLVQFRNVLAKRPAARDHAPSAVKAIDALVLTAWRNVIAALPERSVELESLYQLNLVRFDTRGLQALLGVPEKRRLATALRSAGLRTSASGPLVGLGELRRERTNCIPYEVWTVRGAVAAWSVASRLGLSVLTAAEFGASLPLSRMHSNHFPGRGSVAISEPSDMSAYATAAEKAFGVRSRQEEVRPSHD